MTASNAGIFRAVVEKLVLQLDLQFGKCNLPVCSRVTVDRTFSRILFHAKGNFVAFAWAAAGGTHSHAHSYSTLGGLI